MSVVQTKRKNMRHFQDMKPVEFIRFAQHIRDQMGGVLSGMKTELKVDGLSGRFGKDAGGRAFFEGARTGPIFEPGAFSKHVESKGSSCPEILARSRQYDRLWGDITGSELMDVLPNDSKVICEVFYNPMSQVVSGGVRFVTVLYDPTKLGGHMTVMPRQVVVASTGLPHPQENDILEALFGLSNDHLKVADVRLHMGDIDVGDIIAPACELDERAVEILSSRKQADKPEKERLVSIIQTVKNEIAEHILGHPKYHRQVHVRA